MKKRIPKKHGEIWIEIYPGYLVSNYGRWYSIRYQKILKQYVNSSGYYRADISVNGIRKQIFTHIKVVELFGDKNGNRIPEGITSLLDNGLSIDHVDANKKHNYVSNLELVTHQENCLRRDNRLRSFGGGYKKRK